MALSEKILVRSDKSFIFLKREEIEWIEANGQTTLIHCGEHQYPVRLRIQFLERKLGPEQFIRIHRSYIVNLNSIRELKPRTDRGYDVILQDGTELSWSRYYKNRFNLLELEALTIPANKSKD